MACLNGTAVAHLVEAHWKGSYYLLYLPLEIPEMPEFSGPAEGFLPISFDIFVGFWALQFPRHSK
jgi:hypothetical protein